MVSKQPLDALIEETAMNKYSYINLIKHQAKSLAKTANLKLSTAQEQFSLTHGFSCFHELTTIAKHNKNDPRIMMAAIGTNDLENPIFEESTFYALESEIETLMSGSIAVTNAYSFILEDLEVTSKTYDANTGVLTLKTSFQYSGEQDPDRAWCGSAFFLNADIQLIRRHSNWRPHTDNWVKITTSESDQGRDYLSQMQESYS